MDVNELKKQLAAISAEVDNLHDALESKGVNSRRIKSRIKGELFNVPVDAEHKATQLPIANCGQPHMRAFHASWFGFFVTFFSTFAPAPLAPYLMSSATIGLKRSEIAIGNICSVASNIVMRVVMGFICDKLGARRGLAFILFVTSPAIFGIMFVNDAAGFILCRFVIGTGLASFVACQVWCTQQFSKSIVGTANATAGGWGNLGGGMTNLLMPFVMAAFMSATNNNDNLSWRLTFIVPLVLHLVAGTFVMTGRDLPDGNYKELEKHGLKQPSKAGVVAKVGLSNINAWILTLTYGFCFGVELTMNNVAAQFFHEYFALTTIVSGVLASTFGLINLFARSLGGIVSDLAAAKFGMRGRIWALFIFQMLEGLICMFIGIVTMGKTAPDFSEGVALDTTGYVRIGGWANATGADWIQVTSGVENWVPFTAGGIKIRHCGTKQVTIKDEWRSTLDPRFEGATVVVLSEPPSPLGNGDDCISNSGLLGLVVLLLVLFSVTVQMAEGLTYGVVPYVSRPALGVVSGMVGAGGNAGALITNALFFANNSMRTDNGLCYMGITILAVTLTCVFIYFPESGGMFVRAGGISYDPQRIKPPKGYKGADEISTKTDDTNAEKTKPTANVPGLTEHFAAPGQV